MPAQFHKYLIIAACVFLLTTLLVAAGCTGTDTATTSRAISAPAPVDETHLIRAHYEPGEITRLSQEAEEKVNSSLNAIAAIPPQQRTTDNTLIAYSDVISDYRDAVGPLVIMGMVSPDPATAAEGMAVRESSAAFVTSVTTRRDLYDAMKDAQPRSPDEARLYNVTMQAFVHNGLKLPDDRLAIVREKLKEVKRLEARYIANLNNDTTSLTFTREELTGVPDDVLEGFDRTADGGYLVSVQEPDYPAVMRNAEHSDTRRALYIAAGNVQATENTRLLEEAVALRSEIAHELGYATWADYQLDGRMAKSPAEATMFLEGMKGPLQEKTRAQMADLLAIKKKSDPFASGVEPWDVSYLVAQQNQILYDYDADDVKEYFPADTVIDGMFGICASLFGIRFDEVEGAGVWSPDVRLFRISNITDNTIVGYLYLDLYPRPGKTPEVFESELRAGRMKNGSYFPPVVIIVDNLPRPTADRPPLLTMGDIVTLFHETGHAMHALLTRAPYGTLSGTSVQWDFVETPSQALEEWPYDPEVMESLSGHYQNSSRKIPADLRDRIIAARNSGNGYYYSSQLVYSLYDLRLHTKAPPVDAPEIYSATYADVMQVPLTPGLHTPASFSHIMDEYDAGYYGYLWSKVYALEIVDAFRCDGMTNQTTGMHFRQEILSRGNMDDGSVLLENFLGKKPGAGALYRYIGINVTPAAG